MSDDAILVPHPATPCDIVRRFTARARWAPDGMLAVDYALEGDISGLALPVPAEPCRADGLWRHTCFEAFFAEAGRPGYGECNFSPSGEWAVYRFAAYREGMAAAATVRPPAIALRHDAGRLELGATVDPTGLLTRPGQTGLRLALAAVIEDRAGNLSYWALAHPPGKPDFHHGEGFVLALPPPASIHLPGDSR